MDGANRAFAAPTTFTFAGKTMSVRPRIAEHYAEMEDHLLSLRANPLVAAKELLTMSSDNNPEFTKQVLEVAMAERCRVKSVTRKELSEWMDSMNGLAYCTWIQIRHNDPNYDPENPLTSCKELTPQSILAELLNEFERVLDNILKNTELTGEEAAAAAESLLVDTMQSQLGRPSGEDGLGNSTGPNPSEGEGEKKEHSPGDAS